MADKEDAADKSVCERLLPAFLLGIPALFLTLVVMSVPIIQSIYLLTVPITVGQVSGSVQFGTFGFCLVNFSSTNVTISATNATNATIPTNSKIATNATLATIVTGEAGGAGATNATDGANGVNATDGTNGTNGTNGTDGPVPVACSSSSLFYVLGNNTDVLNQIPMVQVITRAVAIYCAALIIAIITFLSFFCLPPRVTWVMAMFGIGTAIIAFGFEIGFYVAQKHRNSQNIGAAVYLASIATVLLLLYVSCYRPKPEPVPQEAPEEEPSMEQMAIRSLMNRVLSRGDRNQVEEPEKPSKFCC